MAAPDIIFGAEDENFHPFSVTGDEGDFNWPKNSLCDWNSKDPSRLLILIHELRLVFSSLFVLQTILSNYRWSFFRVSENRSSCFKGSVHVLPEEAHWRS